MTDQLELNHADAASSVLPLPISVRVKEACRLVGIGRSKLYELMSSGEIEFIKVGTMTLIPTSSLRAFVELRQRSKD